MRSGVSHVLPPKTDNEKVSTTFRIPRGVLAEVDAVASATGYTRTEVLNRFIVWGLTAHHENRPLKKKK